MRKVLGKATMGLNVRLTVVVGLIQPGVPVIRTGKDDHFPDLPYIIFPGNVGEDESLASIYEKPC